MLPDGEHYLWLSERDGWMHLYLYSLRNGLERQADRGGLDHRDHAVRPRSRPDGPCTWTRPAAGPTSAPRSRARWSGRSTAWRSRTGELEQLTATPGFHEPALSGDGRYLVDQWSAVDTPPVTAS